MIDETWTAVETYFTGELFPPDPVLDAVREANAVAGLPSIDVTPGEGKLLHLLARTVGARRILEIGTLGGYSTVWLARALPADGRLVTCEINPDHAEVARANLARAGMDSVVDVRVGPALDTLTILDSPFDLAFIDADKKSNAEYFRHALRLSRPGTMIVVDNVVREGRVADATNPDPDIRGTRAVTEAIGREPRVDATVIQTVGSKGYDGFLLALVR